MHLFSNICCFFFVLCGFVGHRVTVYLNQIYNIGMNPFIMQPKVDLCLKSRQFLSF